MPIFIYTRKAALLSVSALVAACSTAAPTTGPTPTTPGPPPSGTAYHDLTSGIGQSGTSTLGGIASTNEQVSGIAALRPLTGTLNHSSGATSLTDTVFGMNDPGGSPGVVLSDGTVSYNHQTYFDGGGASASSFTGSYKYVTEYTGTYTVGGTTYDVIGTYGVVTKTADVPTAGTATYSGEAAGTYRHSAPGGYANEFYTEGTSAVSADFTTGKVAVTMNNFVVRDGTGSPLAQTVFDEVRRANMGISGNGFSGGAITFYKNGVEVPYTTVIGAINTTSQSGGTFYGYDSATGAPAEVSGIFLNKGDFGTTNLMFIAN